MASLARRWRPSQSLRTLLPAPALYASPAFTRYCCEAPSQYGRRGLVTTRTKAKTKRAPRKASKTDTAKTSKKDDAPEGDPRLPVLSLAALRNLAVLCGRNSSGTRAVIRADLKAAIEEEPSVETKKPMTKAKAAPPQRILSIDMGVRNLAYCLLQVDGTSAHPVPKLIAWERLSLIGTGSQVETETETEDTGATPSKPPASAFSPPAMAAVAARLIRDRLLPLEPTHILIERQRFRSGGGAAVLEWTVRVNSLEAMLHGIFAYRQQEATEGNTVQSVQPVSPQRASRFLLQGGMGTEHMSNLLPKTRKNKEKDIKDVKEAFVAGLLWTQGSTLTYDEGIKGMADAFLLRWNAKQSRGRAKSKEETAKSKAAKTKPVAGQSTPLPVLSKIDDLADCVAQGLIWLEWEDNKSILRERGADDLLATKQLTE